MFVHPTNTAVILGVFINQKLFLTPNITVIVNEESETNPISEIAIIILSLKLIDSFEAAEFLLLTCFPRGHSLSCLPHFAPLSALSAMRNTRV